MLVDGKAVTKRRDIRTAHVVSQRGESVVRMRRRWPGIDIDIVTEGEMESRALVSALRVSLEQRAIAIVVGWGTLRGQLIRGAVFAVIFLIGLGGVGFLSLMGNREQPSAHGLFQGPWQLMTQAGLLLLLVLGLVAILVRFRATVTVGSDGVLVQRGFARPLFLPYDQIDRVEARESASESMLEIFSRDREPIVCAVWGGIFSSFLRIDAALLGAVARAIDDAKQARGEARAAPKSALARSGRDAQTWARALHDVADGAGDYRAQRIPAEALWSIVCDSATPETQRAGAAVALRSSLDADGRARLRVASATSASPELRIALAAAADEVDEGALAEALASLSDEPPHARAASRRT